MMYPQTWDWPGAIVLAARQSGNTNVPQVVSFMSQIAAKLASLVKVTAFTLEEPLLVIET
jgi:hypothetical protein